MTNEHHSPKNITPKIWQIILIAVIAIAFTTLWLKTYESLNTVIWMNEFVKANRWTIPVGVILFTLAVGLCLKYLHAPDVIHGGFSESMKGDGEHGNYKIFPGNTNFAGQEETPSQGAGITSNYNSGDPELITGIFL